MNIRWRLLLLAIQLAILLIFTRIATGSFYSGATWFVAGVLAVALNRQLLEPYYARPVDVIGNSVISLLLYATTNRTITEPAWMFFALALVVVLITAIVATALGAGRQRGSLVPLARAASLLAGEATAVRIYSVVFWLALAEAFPSLGPSFWTLGIAWAVIVLLGALPWGDAWKAVTGSARTCEVEGMIGPSSLLVSALDVPGVGGQVTLKSALTETNGLVISRIRRRDDVWAEIHIADQTQCEDLVQASSLAMNVVKESDESFVGCVDAGSDDTSLAFCPVRPLEVGKVVSVRDKSDEILYQVQSARVKQTDVKGGSHLQVYTKATQLGVFDSETLRLRRHRWVPDPGTAVVSGVSSQAFDTSAPPDTWLLLGHVLGTEIPVFLDLEATAEGHLAILGMTKMGKTSLAHRIATRLSNDRPVTVLDQTGEWKSRRNVPPYQKDDHTARPGLRVLEPATGKVPPETAAEFLEHIIGQARPEYEAGAPAARALLIDEAHQFVPEPTGLDFKAASRTSSMKFGVLMMQVRKYGISVILISQRTAVVAKSALSQCENIIAFKSVDQTGLEYLEAVAGGDVRDILPRLQQGEALVFGPAITSESPVAIKVSEEQETQSQGAT